MGAIDFQQLEESFFLTLYEPENIVLTMQASELLNIENMVRLIDTYAPLITASERSTGAAFFCTWFAGVCSALQQMLYHSDGPILDLSLSNLSVQLYAGTHYPLFSFKIIETRYIDTPDTDRHTWCKALLSSFYKEQVTPLMLILSQAAQMRVIPLWGQLVYALYDQRENELATASDNAYKENIISQFNILSHDVDASAFGLRKNPFDIKLKFIDDPVNPDQKLLVKTACCLAYRLGARSDYCYTCPRLKEKDRESMRVSCGS
ncbi:(2Fe-2S)-binding protein [Cohnella abietis]|uniref:Ferric siderophore reductase C-terminal domain-containing protein n=1 Tax=Cohnella abietis TaxID=2507935 RepID=A0A3T1CYS4_9BACL|nr:(2Fe-2S)-binding protein [Cohnella abietis]BBI31007.1 hypothetical protein KCTCHS21_04060 [Cohnella abietis]